VVEILPFSFWQAFCADNLSKAGWSWGCVLSDLIPTGRTIWIADAHCDGRRFVMRADEKLNCSPLFESDMMFAMIHRSICDCCRKNLKIQRDMG